MQYMDPTRTEMHLIISPHANNLTRIIVDVWSPSNATGN